MGSNLNKDKSARVYITLQKRVYFAGEMIEGSVHLDCLENRPYRSLMLIFKGDQEIMWTESDGNYSTTYRNIRNTYFHELYLADFDMGINAGQYSFPFTFLAPAAMPSSVYLNSSNFIRYTITACLPKYDNDSADQKFIKTINIRQPPRGQMIPLIGHNLSESKCCSCCCSCGQTELSMQTNITHMVYGKDFRVNGRINTEMSKAKINNYKIVLKEQLKLVSSGQRVNFSSNNYVLYEANRSLQIDQNHQFSADIKIPVQVIGYSALGNVLSRSYFLALVAEMSCCYSNPQLKIHTIFVSDLEPPFQQDQKKPPPQNWNPLVAQPKMFVNMPPYIYQPQRPMIYHNQSGRPVLMREQMRSQEGQPEMIVQIPESDRRLDDNI